MVLALTRYDACACAGPYEEPADDVVGRAESSTDECVPPPADPCPPQPDADSPGDPAIHGAADDVHFVLRDSGEQPGRRFGVCGPRGVRVAADCAQSPCVLDGWWRGPGRYVVWIHDPERERAATLQLVGDELEIAIHQWTHELEVTHRIEGVELRPAEGDEHALTLINRTDRSFVTTFNDGAVLFSVVRAGPRSWAGPRETPQLSCGFGLERRISRPGSTMSLRSLERNLPFQSMLGSQEADTVVVILDAPDDSRAVADPVADGGIVVSHVWAVTTPLPPELMRRLASSRAETLERHREARGEGVP